MSSITATLLIGATIAMSGCGGGDSSAAAANTVTVERGPVLNAVVADAAGQVAYQKDNTLPVYTFNDAITFPVTATGGYIDVNGDGVMDANDTILDPAFVMSSFISNITPLTTMAASDLNESNFENNLQLIADVAGITLAEAQELPSEGSLELAALANAIYLNFELGDGQLDMDANITDEYDDINVSEYEDSEEMEQELLGTIGSLSEDDIEEYEETLSLSFSPLYATFTIAGEKELSMGYDNPNDLNITDIDEGSSNCPGSIYVYGFEDDYNLTAETFNLHFSNDMESGYCYVDIDFRIDDNRTITKTLPVEINQASGYTGMKINIDAGWFVLNSDGSALVAMSNSVLLSGTYNIVDDNNVTVTFDVNSSQTLNIIMPEYVEPGQEVTLDDELYEIYTVKDSSFVDPWADEFTGFKFTSDVGLSFKYYTDGAYQVGTFAMSNDYNGTGYDFKGDCTFVEASFPDDIGTCTYDGSADNGMTYTLSVTGMEPIDGFDGNMTVILPFTSTPKELVGDSISIDTSDSEGDETLDAKLVMFSKTNT